MPLPTPKSGERRQEFIDRCMGDDKTASEYPDQEQRAAVCIQQFTGNALDLTPPQPVRDNYKRGLEMHENGKTGDGIEAGTIKVARDIVAGEAVTEAWVRKANRFWDRNERFLSEDQDSPAYASALLWGGAAGRDWYRKIAKQMEGNGMSEHKAGDQIRVNVRTRVNSEHIRREQRDGRDVIVVKSATMPDDIVMNGIMYPAEEIEKSYHTLEDTPAPLNHPMVNNMFVSAKSPLGLNLGYFGAWNANVHRQDGRVMIDKIIDVERANESKMGRRVLAALEQGKPIHTSTGLMLRLRNCDRSDLADLEGYDMEFDHDAILLDEPGAATPEQGVGMMVNSATGEKIQVINSDIEERMDEHIDMLGMELLSAIDRKEAASRWDQIKGAIMEAVGLGRASTSTERKEAQMAGTEEDFKEVTDRLDKFEAAMNKIVETVEGMGEKLNKTEETVNAINAEREGARDALINKVVEAKLLTEDEAKATPVKALEVMLNASTKTDAPTPAPGVFGAFTGNHDADNVEQFSPLGGEQKKEA